MNSLLSDNVIYHLTTHPYPWFGVQTPDPSEYVSNPNLI
jgi:hypothetical protein